MIKLSYFSSLWNLLEIKRSKGFDLNKAAYEASNTEEGTIHVTNPVGVYGDLLIGRRDWIVAEVF